MQRNCTQIKKWEIAEFIFIAIVGTLLHFVYDWSGQNPAVGIIAPVSESTLRSQGVHNGHSSA